MSAATHSQLSPSLLPDATMQVTTELGQNLSVSCVRYLFSAFPDDCQTQGCGSGLFPNAQNMLITGGTFVVSFPLQLIRNNCTYLIYQYNAHILPPNTREGQMKIPVPQKPNSSPFFTGQKDVLNKLWKIFVHCTDSKLMLRHSCLLWGTGGIGKTQICLKFIEETSNR